MRFGALLILQCTLCSASKLGSFLATPSETLSSPLLPLSPVLASWGSKTNCETELPLEKESPTFAQGLQALWSAKWSDRLHLRRNLEGPFGSRKLRSLLVVVLLAFIGVGSCLCYTWVAKVYRAKEKNPAPTLDHLSGDYVKATQTPSGDENVDTRCTDVNSNHDDMWLRSNHTDMWYNTGNDKDVDVNVEAIGHIASEKAEFYDMCDDDSEVESTCSYFSKSDVQHCESGFDSRSERSYSYVESCDGLDDVCRACAELAPHMCRTCADSFQECAEDSFHKGTFQKEVCFQAVEHAVIDDNAAANSTSDLNAGIGQDCFGKQPSLPIITNHAQKETETESTLHCNDRRFRPACPPLLRAAMRESGKSSQGEKAQDARREEIDDAKQNLESVWTGLSTLDLFMQTLGIARAPVV